MRVNTSATGGRGRTGSNERGEERGQGVRDVRGDGFIISAETDLRIHHANLSV